MAGVKEAFALAQILTDCGPQECQVGLKKRKNTYGGRYLRSIFNK